MKKLEKIIPLSCLLFIGLMLLQSVSVPSGVSAPPVKPNSASAGTFTVENFSDRDLNISLYNLENFATFSFANDELGDLPDYLTNTDPTIHAEIVQNCSVGSNQSLLKFYANPGQSAYKTVAKFPEFDYTPNRIEFVVRFDGNVGSPYLGLLVDGSALFYLTATTYAFPGDSWPNHGLTVTNWNKISIVNLGSTLQLYLNDVLKGSKSYMLDDWTQFSIKLHANNGIISSAIYIDGLDFGPEQTTQTFIDQKIPVHDLQRTRWDDRRPHDSILVHKNSDKSITTVASEYYVVNRDLITAERYEISQGTSYRFIAPDQASPNCQLISESTKTTQWIANQFSHNRSVDLLFTADKTYVPIEFATILYKSAPDSHNLDYVRGVSTINTLSLFNTTSLNGEDMQLVLLFNHTTGKVEKLHLGPINLRHQHDFGIYALENNSWIEFITWNQIQLYDLPLINYIHVEPNAHGGLGMFDFNLNNNGNQSFVIRLLNSPQQFSTNLQPCGGFRPWALVINETSSLSNFINYFESADSFQFTTAVSLNQFEQIFMRFNSSQSISGSAKVNGLEIPIVDNILSFTAAESGLHNIKLNMLLPSDCILKLEESFVVQTIGFNKSDYIPPLQTRFWTLPAGTYSVSIYISGHLKQIQIVEITDAAQAMVIFSTSNLISMNILIIDQYNSPVSFDSIKLFARYQNQKINVSEFITTSSLLIDPDSTIDLVIYDRVFSTVLYNRTEIDAEGYITIQISLYKLRINNRIQREATAISINDTLFNLFKNEIYEILLPTAQYLLQYTNELNEPIATNVNLNETILISLQSAVRSIYFSIFDTSGFGLDLNTVRLFLDGRRTDFRQQIINGSTVHVLALDYFNATLYNRTIEITGISEFNIYVPVYSLSIFNNYSDPVTVFIERSDLSFTQLEQQLSPQSSLQFRFLANEEYTITIKHLNGTVLETRAVNLTDNRYLSFGFYSAEIPAVLVDDSPLWFRVAFFVALCTTTGVIGVNWARTLNKKYNRERTLAEIESIQPYRRFMS